MMEQMLDKAYDWIKEESVSRTVAALSGTAVASLVAGWKLFRKKSPSRINVVVDAPAGEVVDVHIGQHSDD